MGAFAEHSAQRVRRVACFTRDLLTTLDDDDRRVLGERMARDKKLDPSSEIADDLQAVGIADTITRKQLALHLSRHRQGECSCG